MATAVLRVDQVNQCGNYIPNQRIPDEIKKCMSMPRDHVPAQLPQVPLEVWQNFWDDYAKQFADYSIYAKRAFMLRSTRGLSRCRESYCHLRVSDQCDTPVFLHAAYAG